MVLWSIDADRTGVNAVRSRELFLHYRRGYDAAQSLRRVGGLSPELLHEVLAADLAYRVMADVDWGTPEQVESLLAGYNDALTAERIVDALDRARQRGDVPATIGLLRLVSETTDSESSVDALLQPRRGDVAPLVAAASDANTRVRYEAAATITELLDAGDSPRSFPGASYYRNTLAEMAALSAQPTAVLVETRPVVALRQENILGQLGYRVRTATSGLQAERMISEGRDVRLLVSKVQLADITAPELVDRVRRLEKGRNLPIVFYHDEDTHPKAVETVELETTSTRWADSHTPAVHLVPLPGAPAALSEALTESAAKRRLPPLSVSEREYFRTIGQAALEGKQAHR
jgi:CheY-like chemotaxis protein